MKTLRPMSRRILETMARHEYVTRDHLITACWGIEDDRLPDNIDGTLNVHISLLRREVRDLGITIHSLGWGSGQYALPVASRKRAQFILANYIALITGDMKLDGATAHG